MARTRRRSREIDRLNDEATRAKRKRFLVFGAAAGVLWAGAGLLMYLVA